MLSWAYDGGRAKKFHFGEESYGLVWNEGICVEFVYK